MKSEYLAAVDLGSNSFHLIIARVLQGHLRPIDRIKEAVRLADGFQAGGEILPSALDRAYACLARYAERLSGIQPENCRAVGTYALREAANAEQFRARAEAILQREIEVISGREEARLIYLGALECSGVPTGERLVVDIGGGSTEFAVGDAGGAQLLESVQAGCVTLTHRWFADGRITVPRLRDAVTAARVEIEPIESSLLRRGWSEAVGTSGTVRALAEIAADKGGDKNEITRVGLERVAAAFSKVGEVRKLRSLGVSEARAEVLPGGYAVLRAVFEALALEKLVVSDGALRDGVLVDMLGRKSHHDLRTATVDAMLAQYHVERQHAAQIEATALLCLRQVAGSWHLDQRRCAKWLSWAARLHEIGLAVSHSQYHKHGAYLIQFSDLPGFSRQDQERVAFLVRAHRRKFPLCALADLPADQRDAFLRLALLLRLSVLCHRARSALQIGELHVDAQASRLKLCFLQGTLAQRPLLEADLKTEAAHWESFGYRLQIREGT